MAIDKGITVKQLAGFCVKLIEAGYGDKHVLISNDDEGNGFHTLFYEFMTSLDDIKCYAADGLLHDDNDPNEVVLLG